MQKTKTKTGIAVALVAFSIISTVAAATIIIRRQGGSSIIGGVKSIVSKSTETSTITGTTDPTTAVSSAPTPVGKYKPISQVEFWPTKPPFYKNPALYNYALGSIYINRSPQVQQIVGKEINEKVIASFSPKYGSLEWARCIAENKIKGIDVSSEEIDGSRVECTISGKAEEEGVVRIIFKARTKDSENRAGQEFSDSEYFVFSECSDGQEYDEKIKTCKDILLGFQEPTGLIDLTHRAKNNNAPSGATRNGRFVNGAGIEYSDYTNGNWIVMNPGEIRYFKIKIYNPEPGKKATLNIDQGDQQGLGWTSMVVRKDALPTREDFSNIDAGLTKLRDFPRDNELTNKCAQALDGDICLYYMDKSTSSKNPWYRYTCSQSCSHDISSEGGGYQGTVEPGTYYIALYKSPVMAGMNGEKKEGYSILRLGISEN